MAVLAIARSGAIAMPISEQLGAPELERIVGHSECRRVITTTDHLKILAKVEGAGELAVVLLDDDEEADRHGLSVQGWRELRGGSGELPELEPDQPAVLVYTSGTTGTPKGVPLTHANLCANLDALVAERLARPGDRVLLPLPLQHVYPLTVGLLAPLASGAAVVLPAGITRAADQRGAAGVCLHHHDRRAAAVRGHARRHRAQDGRARDRSRSAATGACSAFSTWLLRRFGWRTGRLLFCAAASPGRPRPPPARVGRRAAQARDRSAAQRAGLGGSGGLRAERDLADPDLQPEGPRAAGLGGPAGQGHRASGSSRSRTSSQAPARSRRAGPACSPATGTTRRPPRRASPTTASSAPAISAASTTTAICSSSAAARR